MTRLLRHVSSIFVIGLLTAAIACSRGEQRQAGPAEQPGQAAEAGRPEQIPHGGDLVVSIRTEPASFNRLTKSDSSTDLVSSLLHARLVRINRATQELEPSLAEGWTRADDGLHYTVRLRPGVTFSDGAPLTSADVLFSLAAVYDEKTASPLAPGLTAGSGQIRMSAPDPQTVVVTFPQPFAPGLRILDSLPILPKHKLQAALDAGTLADAWGLSTPRTELAGAGPFVLADYTPGQQLVFERNPKYFGTDAAGARLPYLDRIVVKIIPDQNAELLALEGGQIDMTTSDVRPEDYAPLKRAAEAGRIKLLDLGVAYDADMMWFNLRPGAFDRDPRRDWIQRPELRHAIMMAVDRKVFADTVYLGAGVPVYGPITPANRKWFSTEVPTPPYDPARAKQLIASISGGQPVRFTLMTQKGRTALERGASVIRDELKKIGVTVDVVLLDGGALFQRVFDPTLGYDAVYFSLFGTDTEPNSDYWLSSGSGHAWNLMQKTPATPWEKQIDELFARQAATFDEAERKRLFVEIQTIFAEHLPALYFVAPRVFAASSTRVINVQPGLIRPQLLWAPDTVAVTGPRVP